MLKITIKAPDESTLNRILNSLQQTTPTAAIVDAGMSLEHFDTDVLLTEARRRLHKDGYVVNVVPDESTKEPPKSKPEAAKRRGRPPRTAAPAAASNGAPATIPSPLPPSPPPPPPPPPPSRSEVVDALEKYSEQNGMGKAREIMADVSGIKGAALKDVNPVDYRRLMEALAC